MADVKGIGLGLTGKRQSDWPKVSEDDMEKDPILRLEPDSELHRHVKSHILSRLEWSERKMSLFYQRWRDNENRLQAYVVPKSAERRKAVEEQNVGDDSEPEVYDIVVPYGYATISTICTYLMQTFAGRSPIFGLKSDKKESVKNAKLMERVVQYGLDNKNFGRHLWNYLWNGQTYGVGILRSLWCKEMKHRTRWVSGERQRGLETVYEGNETISVDPFNFFPDPSVPMVEVPQRGEFVFWRSFESKHSLLTAQSDGLLHWVEKAAPLGKGSNFEEGSRSSERAGGSPLGVEQKGGDRNYSNNVMQVDQGTMWIIPKEMGLGTSEYPQRWLFTIVNKSQVVQAEPYEVDHDMHPVSVSEPYAFGQGFGNLGMADFLGPIQDSMSWLVNSHMDSVKEILNSTFVVDPSRLEMQDFQTGKKEHGRMIRLKSSAIGTDVRTALHQVAVQDVTQSHISDLKVMQQLGDAISGVNDNMRGLQDTGSRKTATEVRVTGEAGASRLATLAKVISLQSLKITAEQHIYNIQQFMSEPFYLLLTGREGQETPIQVFPEMLVGDFHYVAHDGTLPIDKVATVEAWVQVLQMIGGDPELRQQFDFVSMIEYVGEMAGAKGIDEFRVNVQEAGPGDMMPPGAMPIGGPTDGQGGPEPGGAGDAIADALGGVAGNIEGMGAGGPIG